MFFLQLPHHKLSCSRTVTFLVKILYSGPAHGFIQFNRAGYTVRRSTQQAKLDEEKVHPKNRLSRHCSSCVVSCLTTFKHGNKLCSSVSEPSLAFSGVARPQEASRKSLQYTLPAAIAYE